jgi:hypothetical protein
MRVTIKDITNNFNVQRDKVKQVKSQQLFIVDLIGGRVLISYYTVVGLFHNSTWFIDERKYSVTTTKQVNQFRRSTKFESVILSPATFDDLRDAIARV